MTWQKMFLHLLEIHDLYLCMFVCMYFLYIFICICVHACLYFLYIFSWVDSLPCGAMAGSKREGRWERFRITKLSSIESSTLWEKFDSKYKIFFNRVIAIVRKICFNIQNIPKRNHLINELGTTSSVVELWNKYWEFSLFWGGGGALHGRTGGRGQHRGNRVRQTKIINVITIII